MVVVWISSFFQDENTLSHSKQTLIYNTVMNFGEAICTNMHISQNGSGFSELVINYWMVIYFIGVQQIVLEQQPLQYRARIKKHPEYGIILALKSSDQSIFCLSGVAQKKNVNQLPTNNEQNLYFLMIILDLETDQLQEYD